MKKDFTVAVPIEPQLENINVGYNVMTNNILNTINNNNNVMDTMLGCYVMIRVCSNLTKDTIVAKNISLW